MSDLSKLSPAPFEAVRQAWAEAPHIPTGKFVLASGMTLVAIYEREEDADAAALARNAFDVMMRRGWRVIRIGEKWEPQDGDGRYFVRGDATVITAADPFTALVEADEWYKRNVENVPQ